MFFKIAIDKVEEGCLIITSGEYKASNWTNPKLHGLEIVKEPTFLEGGKRALVTYRDENGKLIDGCLKVVNDNGWDIIILETPYDNENDKPTDFTGEIIVPAIVKNSAADEAITGAMLKRQSISTLAEFKKHKSVVVSNDTFGAMVIKFDENTEFINISRGDGTQVMDLKLHHLAPGFISNWRVMKYESDDAPVIFPVNDTEFGVSNLIFKVISFIDK
ncbi:MAG: hypothetical protein IJP62_01970 [Treponema sp.]|nr:hypothetical protein [Treponema sp.]